MGDYQPGVYVPLKALFLVYKLKNLCILHGHVLVMSKIGPGPEVIKLFSCSTQLSLKFKLLISDKIEISGLDHQSL